MAKQSKKTKASIMFVCTGNTCRSPMAEFMFKAYLKDKGRSSDFTVSSAGISPERGSVLSGNAARALELMSVPFNKDRKARVLTVLMARDADLIIAMSERHAQMCGGNCTSFERIGGAPISDPYGGPLTLYLDCASQMRDCFAKILALCDEALEAKRSAAQ